MPYANPDAMNEHLKEIGKAVSPGAHGVILLDVRGGMEAKSLRRRKT